MMVYPADVLKAEPDRPLAMSAGWGSGKPEVSYKLDDPFRGLALGIKFQGTTAEAISRRWVWQSFLILGVLSVLMIGGLVLTYRSVNKQVALARLKSDFVSNVSHELRTPLRLIRLYAETLELGRINTQEKKHEYYSIIRKESERLSALINNILDFSRIEAGGKSTTSERLTLRARAQHARLVSLPDRAAGVSRSRSRSIPGIPAVKSIAKRLRARLSICQQCTEIFRQRKFPGRQALPRAECAQTRGERSWYRDRAKRQGANFEKFYRTCDPLGA
jgi:signal transduction histidine kinase